VTLLVSHQTNQVNQIHTLDAFCSSGVYGTIPKWLEQLFANKLREPSSSLVDYQYQAEDQGVGRDRVSRRPGISTPGSRRTIFESSRMNLHLLPAAGSRALAMRAWPHLDNEQSGVCRDDAGL
jgi:hypothetical protein